jgi:hypothetical protein
MAELTLIEYNKAIVAQNQIKGNPKYRAPMHYLPELISGSPSAIVWQALVDAGVECRLGGCGCCGSPSIEIGDDEDEHVRFSTVKVDIEWRDNG